MIRSAHWSKSLALLALSLVLLPQAALARNGAGHRLVALVAWEQLDEPTRAAIVELLKEHERFGADFKGSMPDDVRAADADTKNRWIFLQAAAWPNIAGHFTGSRKEKHHHASWHYINQPIFLTETDEAALWKQGLPINVGMTWFPSMGVNEMNAIQALQRARVSLRNPAAPASEKALALTWLLHLVGDLHQPMQSTALFSLGRFPQGDGGGHEIPTTVRRNLHAYWD